MNTLISRPEARAAGLTRFFNGKPCPQGQIAERYVSDGKCSCYQCGAAKRVRDHARIRADRAAKSDQYNARSKAWIANNAERNRKNKSAWKAKNNDLVVSYHAARRAAKLKAAPKWFSELDEFAAVEAAALCKAREATTGIKWQIDHMIPLQSETACGLHCATNFQVIPKSLNSMKRNRMMFTEPFQWMGEI